MDLFSESLISVEGILRLLVGFLVHENFLRLVIAVVPLLDSICNGEFLVSDLRIGVSFRQVGEKSRISSSNESNSSDLALKFARCLLRRLLGTSHAASETKSKSELTSSSLETACLTDGVEKSKSLSLVNSEGDSKFEKRSSTVGMFDLREVTPVMISV